MTSAPVRRRRWSKGAIRVLAWVTGGLVFLVSGGALARAPVPDGRDDRAEAPTRLIIRRVERRIVFDPPTVIVGGGGPTAAAPTTGTPNGTTSTSTGGVGSGGGSGGTTTGGS